MRQALLIDELPVTLNLLQWSIVRSALADAIALNHERGFHHTARGTRDVYNLVCQQTERLLTEASRMPADEEVA